jgi:cell division protein FtsQ
VARKASSSAVQEELYPLPNEAPEREPFDDSRLIDLEAEQESPFLRGQKRISVRRGSLPKQTAHRLKWIALAVFILGIVSGLGATLYSYGKHSWRFRIDSSDQIEITGAEHVTRAQIMEVMGGDIGRNIFFVPLAERKHQLEQIPWVQSASVMRFVPNRLGVEIHERTPVAFVRIGSRISLIDAGGTLMELGQGSRFKYSFPVITGMNSGEPLSTRAARMKNYNELVRQLDSDGASYSKELSEVDLGDPEDVKVVASDATGEVLVHLGSGNYLLRYKTFVTHVQQWRQQFDKLESVDLRYDGQIIVNPDLEGIRKQPVLTPAAAKAAMNAGVKPAAIVNYEKYVAHPPAAPAKKKANAALKSKPKPALHRAAQKAKARPRARAAAKNSPARIATAVVPAARKTPTLVGPLPPPAQMTKKTAAVPAAAQASKPVPATTPPATTATSQKKPSAGIPKEAAPQ